MSSSFSPTPEQEILDWEHWMTAPDLLAHVDIHPGMAVAEIGAGTASYAVPIGWRVGPSGTVFAVEWRPWLMGALQSRLAEFPLANVRLVEGLASETHLLPRSCDAVVLADVWHEFADHGAVLAEVRRILRDEGKLAILNWRPDGRCPPGPPIEHRISLRNTLRTVELNSWTLVKTACLAPDGYMLVFSMTDESVQS